MKSINNTPYFRDFCASLFYELELQIYFYCIDKF